MQQALSLLLLTNFDTPAHFIGQSAGLNTGNGVIQFQTQRTGLTILNGHYVVLKGGGSIQLSSEENGYAKATVNTTPEGIENNVVWLRLQKKGDVYTAFYSADGKKFVEAGKLETGLKDIKAGIIACDGVMPSFGGFRRGAMPMADPKPMTASFDYFRIISK